MLPAEKLRTLTEAYNYYVCIVITERGGAMVVQLATAVVAPGRPPVEYQDRFRSSSIRTRKIFIKAKCLRLESKNFRMHSTSQPRGSLKNYQETVFSLLTTVVCS